MNHTFGNGTMRDVKRHFREVEKAKKAEVRELRAKNKRCRSAHLRRSAIDRK